MHDAQKGRGLFRIPCRNPSPAFEPQKGLLHQLAHWIQVPILWKRRTCRLFLGGMIGTMFRRTASVSMVSLSFAFSARSAGASKPFVKLAACGQSATGPAVTRTRSGRPCSSTARWILVLSPILCAPWPHCLHYPGRLRVHLHIAGVDDEPLLVGFVNQPFQNRFPEQLVAPAAGPAMGVLRIAKIRGKILPRGPGA